MRQEKKKAKDEEAEAEVDVKNDHLPGHRQDRHNLDQQSQRLYMSKANHRQDHVSQEQAEWSTVKNKKQAKDCT